MRHQPAHDGMSQYLETLLLQRSETFGAGLSVDYAQRAERHPFSRNKRCAGVEPDVRRTYHQLVAGEHWMLCRIRHDHGFGAKHRVSAKALRAGRFLRVHPAARDKALPLRLHHADKRDRGVAQPGGELHDRGKFGIVAQSVETERSNHGRALILVAKCNRSGGAVGPG